MIENCLKCGTSYKIDKNKINSKIKILKCSVCDFEWYLDTNHSLNKNVKFSNNPDNVKRELEAIRSEINKNTSKISKKNNNSYKSEKKQKKITKNRVFGIKNKSINEIAHEISDSTEKEKFRNIKLRGSDNNLIKERNIYSETSTGSSNFTVPTILLFVMLLLSSLIYFRSTLIGYSYAYLPEYTQNYFPKIYKFLDKINIPFNAELNKIEISNFGATYEKGAIKFFGDIKNKSKFPIIMPTIKAVIVTEDGKILAETIIPLKKKYILSKNEISFSYEFKTSKNFDNTIVRATLLKKIELNL